MRQNFIVLLIWILLSVPFILKSQDTTYCLSIQKARFLVSDAYAKRILDSLVSEQAGKIVLLEREKAVTWQDFNAQLINEQAKTDNAIQLSEEYKKLSDEYLSRVKYLEKHAKKARHMKNLTLIGGLILLTLLVVK